MLYWTCMLVLIANSSCLVKGEHRLWCTFTYALKRFTDLCLTGGSFSLFLGNHVTRSNTKAHIRFLDNII